MHSWNNSSCLFPTTLSFQWTAGHGHGPVCLPARVRNPAMVSQGREGGDGMRLPLLGNPAGLHLLLRAPGKGGKWRSCFLHTQHLCTHAPLSVILLITPLGSSLIPWQRSWWWHGFCWQPAVPCLGSGTLLLFPSFPACPGCRRILWKKAEYQVSE